MKAGAYSDSLTAANGDPLKDLKETLYGIVLLCCDFPQNSFEHHFLRFGLQRQLLIPLLSQQNVVFNSLVCDFFGAVRGLIWMHLQI